MKRWSIILRIIVALAVIAYVLWMPEVLRANLGINAYDRWMSTDEEDYTGVITVWHVVGFKPYKGSLSQVLASVAKRVEKRHHGVFINVMAMDEDEYALRIARGEHPDIYSFPLGLCYPEQLSELRLDDAALRGSLGGCGLWNGKQYAAAYCLSAHVLLVNARIANGRGVALPEAIPTAQWLNEAYAKLTYTYGKRGAVMHGAAGDAVAALMAGLTNPVEEDASLFKSGNAAMAIADMRYVADMNALQLAGKGFTFEAYPLYGYTSLVQLIGMAADMEAEKAPYASEFINMLYERNTQEELEALGLIGAVEAEAGEDTIDGFVAKIRAAALVPQAPNAFLYQRYQDALYETAKRAQKGDAEAAKDFEARVKELVNEREIQ